jgi:hypothetical protein
MRWLGWSAATAGFSQNRLDILLRVKEQRCQFWSALTCQSFGMRRLVAAGPSSRALKAVTSYRTP